MCSPRSEKHTLLDLHRGLTHVGSPRGHPWIYLRDVLDPDSLIPHSPGLLNVQDLDGEFLGAALYNSHGAIAGRIISPETFVQIDAGFLAQKLRKCLAYRERFYTEPYYRLVHNEADGLPGLNIDRFGDHVCVQPNSPAWDHLLWPLADAVEEVLNPKVIVIRRDTAGRRKERASSMKKEVLKGSYNGETEIRENGVAFSVDLLNGQKSGWYYDQRDNRAMLAKYAAQAPRVLDCHSYIGGFGVTMAFYGSERVVCVDTSELALELCGRAAAMNSVSSRVEPVRADVIQYLEDTQAARQAGDGDPRDHEFDMVILDPPNLGGDRTSALNGLRFYERLICAAAGVCASPGLIFVASCTYHIDTPDLIETASRALRWSNRTARIVATGAQSADHPGNINLPETRYLRAVLLHLD
eukprot:TRINITY_DN53390_c0_g2_i2.p1 TRINITY_DN53390_c0_g2~~TRINITY_DN53390_c0_g2_i2.p1  ORF type:complete len:412 (+),score=38.20 TRINITY_DN53390_c0_g2_i2:117-1352(+)